MFRRAEHGIATIVRYNAKDAIVIFAPPFDAAGEWHEIVSGMKSVKTHTFAETMAALGGDARMVVEP
jgi:23S rRNA A2030 N6-methylase RlmJ